MVQIVPRFSLKTSAIEIHCLMHFLIGCKYNPKNGPNLLLDDVIVSAADKKYTATGQCHIEL